MKTVWSWIAKILFVVVIVQAWFLYDFYRDKQQLAADNAALESRLLISEQALVDAQQEIASLEKKSLEGMLRDTNKAVISGWESLLNKVQEELEKAKDAIPGADSKNNGSEQQTFPDDEDATTTPGPTEPNPAPIQGERT